MRWRKRLSHLPLHAFLIGIAILWLIPSLGLLISSFRPRQDILHSGWWTVIYHPLGTRFTLDNYKKVLFEEGIGRAFLNSFIITVPATLLCLTVAALAAYALAWMEFRGRRVLLAIIVGLIVVPLPLSLSPRLGLDRPLPRHGAGRRPRAEKGEKRD